MLQHFGITTFKKLSSLVCVCIKNILYNTKMYTNVVLGNLNEQRPNPAFLSALPFAIFECISSHFIKFEINSVEVDSFGRELKKNRNRKHYF